MYDIKQSEGYTAYSRAEKQSGIYLAERLDLKNTTHYVFFVNYGNKHMAKPVEVDGSLAHLSVDASIALAEEHDLPQEDVLTIRGLETPQPQKKKGPLKKLEQLAVKLGNKVALF
jgi:hypothetical protein